jgi:hypothetical protein
VHSPADSPAKREFLACATQQDCAQLQPCATQRWTALAGTRHSPAIKGVTEAADPCKSGCRWLYACMITGTPPGEAYLDPQFEVQMQSCIEDCEDNPGGRETMAKLAACLPTHCGYELAYECWKDY